MEKPGWAVARARAQRGPGQMGQQMDKEAEPPLICSTKKVWPHPKTRGRRREAERETHILGCTVKQAEI